jgi:hypothetical protein
MMTTSRPEDVDKPTPRTKYLPYHVVVRIAGAAGADPRTVYKFCQGYDMRNGLARERIEKALAAAGIAIVGQEQAP